MGEIPISILAYAVARGVQKRFKLKEIAGFGRERPGHRRIERGLKKSPLLPLRPRKPAVRKLSVSLPNQNGVMGSADAFICARLEL